MNEYEIANLLLWRTKYFEGERLAELGDIYQHSMKLDRGR